MDAGGLSREWMNLLVHSIFQPHQTDLIVEDEDRYVMRIDHVTPTSSADENNIRYFKDTSIHSKDFRDLFMYSRNELVD